MSGDECSDRRFTADELRAAWIAGAREVIDSDEWEPALELSADDYVRRKVFDRNCEATAIEAYRGTRP